VTDAALTIHHEPARNERAALLTPPEMLSSALERGMSIEVITRLMDLSDRYQATQARRAFDEAISDAKSRIPVIPKSSKGHNDKRYADFAAIARVVDPIISEVGLSYRFRTTQTDRISVTCVLSHKAGHSEETTLSGPADASGSKNAIQAIGSTLTYLQRYTLVQALGLAASDDDDGKVAGSGETITEEQVAILRELLEATGSDHQRFLAFVRRDHLADIAADKFAGLVAMLKRKEATRG